MRMRALTMVGGLTFLVKVSGTLLAFGILLVLARLLDARDFGSYVYVQTWINVMVVFAGLGLPLGSVRFIPGYVLNARWDLLAGYLRASLLATLATAAVGALAMAAAGALGPDDSGSGLLLAAGGVLLASALFSTLGSLLQALGHPLRSEVPQLLLRPVLTMLCLGAMALLSVPLTVASAMTATLVSCAVVLPVMAVLLRRRLPPAARSATPACDWGQWRPAAMAFVLMLACALLNERMDVFMIGIMLDMEQVGLYSAAARYAQFLAFGLGAVNTLLAPTMARLHTGGHGAELQRAITGGALLAAVLTLPGAALLVLFGRPLLELFGADFAAAYPALVALVVPQAVAAMTGLAASLTVMCGHNAAMAVGLVASVLLNVALNLLLIPAWGLLGAAVATAVSNSALVLGMAAYAKLRLGFNTTLFNLPALRTVNP